MGTKKEPGKFDCYAKLEEDEPFFVLRGKDPVGWALVQLWIQLREALETEGHIRKNAEKNEEAATVSFRMREWALKENSELVKDILPFILRQAAARVPTQPAPTYAEVMAEGETDSANLHGKP